jgi:hypothetical protein
MSGYAIVQPFLAWQCLTPQGTPFRSAICIASKTRKAGFRSRFRLEHASRRMSFCRGSCVGLHSTFEVGYPVLTEGTDRLQDMHSHASTNETSHRRQTHERASATTIITLAIMTLPPLLLPISHASQIQHQPFEPTHRAIKIFN